MGKLYVVGTPIGNLGDFSPRAMETLEKVDFIAAEDTRVTAKLLNRFGIKKPMVIYQKFNEREQGEVIVSRLAAGESCAIVTDAGMPCISDPGETLVKMCVAAEIPIEAVPGPSAVISALAVSGLSVSRFTFEGFLSVKRTSRMEHLHELLHERRTMVFYEAPHKLADTLRDLHTALGDRNIAIIKELTKIHESAEFTTLAEVDGKYDDVKLKGEYVIIVEAKSEAQLAEEAAETAPDPVELARRYIADGLSKNEAAKRAAKETGAKKGDIYKLLLNENTADEGGTGGNDR